MTIDFKSALIKGLSTAEKINLSKKEIGEKIESIADAILEGTNGKVGLVLVENSNHKETLFGNKVQSMYVVSKIDEKNGTKIGNIIEDGDNGYPVTIDTGPSKYICNNINEIELSFSDIVQTTTVANAIFSLMTEN